MMLSAGNGFIMQSDKYSRYNAGQSLKKYILLKKGELAYNHGASKAKQFGCCYELLEDEALIPYVYHCFKVDKNEYTPYVAFLLNNPKIDRQLKRLVSSSARMDGLLNISFKDYMSINLSLPPYAEQKQVSDFIKRIDERIVIQEQLISSLKKYKRGVIKTIFDTLTPVSKSSIGKMATMFSGGTPRSDIVEYYNGSIPFIRSGEIHNDFTELHLSQIGLDNSSAKMVRKGDLLYALYGATSGEVDISKIDGAINQAILCIRTNEISSEYLALWLEINKNNILSKMLQGGQGNLSGELVKSLVVPIYSKTEEQVIVRIGNSINKLIDANTNMLYMLNKAKESLLQQMFI
ncbi:restriction endonuclease subunit S [Ruminococcus sp. AM36-18]|nr:restriction endonuclease subunit S [Ruminococcus sp. AM36-18]RGH57093.1 restriction endonuclease subunit S [Ruminococcus sp. AM36-18]